jgi:hypothetical protein
VEGRAKTIEEYFGRCLELVKMYKYSEFAKASELLGDIPLLSYLEATRGRFDLDELAIEFYLDDRITLTSYLSGLYEQSVGVVEWVLLTGAELMQNGHNKEQ